MDFDLAINQFKEALISLINESGLPPTVIAMQLQLILPELNAQVEAHVANAKKELAEKQNQEEESADTEPEGE